MTREIETITFGEAIAAYGFGFAARLLHMTRSEQAAAIEDRTAAHERCNATNRDTSGIRLVIPV